MGYGWYQACFCAMLSYLNSTVFPIMTNIKISSDKDEPDLPQAAISVAIQLISGMAALVGHPAPTDSSTGRYTSLT
jgi:hypothetical protein